MKLDLYEDDFEKSYAWLEICELLDIDGYKTKHIVLDVISAEIFDENEEDEDDNN